MKINKSLIIVMLSIIVGVALFSWVLSKYPFDEVVSTLENATWPYIVAFLIVSAAIMAVFTMRWKVLLDAQGFKGLKFYELFSYRAIDYGVSYLTPTAKLAGEPVRAAMLMRNGIKFRDGLTTITIDKTIELSFSVVLFALGCFFLILSEALSGGTAVFLAVFCLFLIFINWTFYYRVMRGQPIFSSLFNFFHLDKIRQLAKYQNAITEFEKPILSFYKEKRGAYFAALGLTIIAFMLSLAEYWLLLKMVGVSPTLTQVFLVFSVVGFAFLIPVPMGLGSLEALQAWLFSSMMMNSAAGLGIAILIRARDLIWVFFAIIFAVYYGSLKTVMSEAFNSKYTNPVVGMTVFRGGKKEYVKIPVFRKMGSSSHPVKEWIGEKIDTIEKRFEKQPKGPMKFDVKRK
jgi:uncharacterized protein (TIRG00374 family)